MDITYLPTLASLLSHGILSVMRLMRRRWRLRRHIGIIVAVSSILAILTQVDRALVQIRVALVLVFFVVHWLNFTGLLFSIILIVLINLIG